MTNLEFKEVMGVLKVEPNENCGKEYFLNGTKFSYLEDGSVEIRNLPLDVEIILYETYVDLIKELVDSYDLNESFVYTKESLATIVYELQKYCNSELLEYYNLDDLHKVIIKINERILERVIPSISPSKWMKYDKLNNVSYERCTNYTNKGIIQSNLKDVLNLFDYSVNPYIDEETKTRNVADYIGDINISGDVFDVEDEEFAYRRNDCCNLTLSNDTTCVCYERKADGFSCSLNYSDESCSLYAKHSYCGNSDIFYERGEIVTVECFENNKKTTINYNITKDLEIICNDDEVIVKKMPFNKKINLIWHLYWAASSAEELTVKNMVIDEPGKILEMK